MSTLADAMLAWKAKLTTEVTPEQVLTLRSDVNVFVDDVRFLESENAELRELVRGLHMAYIGIIGQCESFDSSLTWEFSSDIDADLAKQHAIYEQDRHRFDVAMRELGVDDG